MINLYFSKKTLKSYKKKGEVTEDLTSCLLEQAISRDEQQHYLQPSELRSSFS